MTDLEGEIDRLFELPLAAFTEARTALAVRLKKDGDAAGAARVKALVKPTATAWAVNQLHWRAPQELEALVAAGDRVRLLQARGAAPEEHREAARERREAIGAAARRAQEALEAGGHTASAAALQRLATTLEAVASYGSARSAEIRLGRLVADLAPPGFDALAALVIAPSPAVPPPAAKAGTDAGAEQARFEKEVALLRRQADASRQAAIEAARRLDAARADLVEAERRVENARERVKEAAGQASRAHDEANRAAAAVEAAERESQDRTR